MENKIDEKIQKKLYSDDNIDVTTYKCPNCKGEAVFDPTLQKMKCLYCGSEFEIENSATVSERDLSELLTQGQDWSEADVYQCSSCGAKEIIDQHDVSHVCPFCGTSNIVKTDELPGLKPQGIVPFKISAEKSSQIATSWAKKKKYAPIPFKKSVKAENIHGIYNPVFTFDADTDSFYDGRLGKYYTTYRYENGRRVAHTETRYFNIRGRQQLSFDDFLVQASSNMPMSTINAIEPFPTNNAPEYTSEYLRGYSASTYNTSGSECWESGKRQMKAKIEAAILKKYDYDVKSYLKVNTSFSNLHYKYILVPVYVGHYNYKNKLYNFFINGVNGKITGKTPVSFWKVFFTVLAILLVVGGIIAYFVIFD